jgi:ElaB/YqjD/DUF883 family membrane-anchored ribosome-binding protein
MPALTEQQRKFYEQSVEMTRQEVSDLKDQIEEELSKVKERIADLQNAIAAARQMHEAACNRLGIPNDLEDEDSGQG